MALPFSYCTLSQARQELANRLYDSGMVFWAPDELTLYIQEALQTFNCLAKYWRGDFVFDTVSDAVGYGDGGYGDGGYGGSAGSTPSTWYDISLVPNSLRPYTVTDVDIYTIMEYHLLEEPSGATWTGTTMFTANDLISAVQRRRDEILSITGCTITQSLLPTTPGKVRNVLNDFVLDVRRIAWFPVPPTDDDVAVPNVLWPEDNWSFQAFEDGYTTAPQGTPNAYSLSAQPPITFDVDYTPQQEGSYELLTVNAGPALSAAQPTVINIPTDFAWVLKWGALADLLSRESEAKDVLRAEYCNQRYQQGLKLMSDSPALLQLRINNVPLWIDAVRAADEYATDWQGRDVGTPENVLVAGLNLIALSPKPPDAALSATCTVVRNAPIPGALTDFVQMGRDDYDVMLDYAQHLALFKNGGQEFIKTKTLYSRFVQQAAIYNSKLQESGNFQDELYGTSQREEKINPRLTKSVAEASGGE